LDLTSRGPANRNLAAPEFSVEAAKNLR